MGTWTAFQVAVSVKHLGIYTGMVVMQENDSCTQELSDGTLRSTMPSVMYFQMFP